MGIFQEQMSAIHPLLPGSRKPVPYIVESGERVQAQNECISHVMISCIFLENDRIEQGKFNL